ncbi:hypothetical protein [[Phormidium] sp. ETS-05]|uniref:CASTOR/POLLUX-related putative ion channel n=1 Tax=[Phormidium] sp. ETS-05 TaxID=222819 RepID=UPI0018EEF164|nr:hypothetical protein [[Phormidium] sp. ETS-05]
MRINIPSSQEAEDIKKRLQYNFDNFMSKGGLSVFLALMSLFFAAFVVMTAMRYLIEVLFPNQDPENTSGLYWDVFVQLIGLRDTGDTANLATKLIGVLTIFIGLVLFSSLVAFITQEFEARIQMLKKGKSLVVETNHTLILGFNDRITDLLKELVEGNESELDAAVVILSPQDKEEMDDFIRNNIEALKTTRVITRNGSVTNLHDLEKVGVKVAKSVLILNDAKPTDSEEFKELSDARVVKAVLAVIAASEEEKLPPILVELHLEKYRHLAENIIPGAVITINEADILARILVQTSRCLGLAGVYLNLVGFEDNEFYFYLSESGWNNLTFGQLPFHFSHGIPLGVRSSDDKITIKPTTSYKLADDDEVIILAEDDSAIKFHPTPVVQPKQLGYTGCKKLLERQPEKHMLIGWNNKAPIALNEYGKYLLEGSEVRLAINNLTDEVRLEFDKIAKAYPHIKMVASEVKLDSLEELATLKPYEFNSISILSGREASTEEIDAKTLTTLLQVRQIFRDYTARTGTPVTTELVAEIIDSEATELAIKAGVKDFLLTNQLVSKIIAQVSQEPDVISIYRELFSEEGCEVYMKPLWVYFPPEKIGQLTFADCVLAAQNRDEVCLGVKKNSILTPSASNFGIELLPGLDKVLTLSPNDALITIAEDDT